MRAITARPERILGNVALASLMAGVPIGVLFAIAYLVTDSDGATFARASQEVAACLFAPTFVCFVAGVIGLGLPLTLLRWLGFAGPAIAIALCAALGLALAAGMSRPGVALGVIATSLLCAVVFCRFAYPSDADAIASGRAG